MAADPPIRENIFIVEETFDNITADVIVCFVAVGCEKGFGWYDQLLKETGPELHDISTPFRRCAPGSARIVSSFGIERFRAIELVFVPDSFRMDATALEAQRVRAIVKNAIDVAIEAGFKTLVFPTGINNTPIDWVAPVLMRAFREWAHESPYVDELGDIRIVCIEHADYTQYAAAAARLHTASDKRRRQKHAEQDQFEMDVTMEEESPNTSAIARSAARGRRKNEPIEPIPMEDIEHMKSNGMFLVLSAKLEPTILNLKDEDGKKRQYRMTNRSRDGRKLYFRCSRCDTLAKKNPDAVRARLIICNGEIHGDEYPTHHPECEPWTDEQLLVQQIDRSSRKTVKEGLLQPFEAYQDALTRISSVVATDSKVIELPRFPEWSQVRGQYCRIKKKADRLDSDSDGMATAEALEQEQCYEELPESVEGMAETEAAEESQEAL